MSEEYREFTEVVHLVWPDWEVAEKLGSGAFATVVRASRKNRISGENDAAIKIIRIPNSDSDWDMVLAEGKTSEHAEQYFQGVVDDSLKEIRAMVDLAGNTNIVSIFDYKVHRIPERHVWYILIRMEYLQKVKAGQYSEEEVIRLGVDVCTALSVCRKKNIVHRDVSLDNIFIHDGNYKLGDFGVAKVLEGTIGTMHSIAGKPLYMAPEVYNAKLEDTDINSAAKVDIYSLGILLYRLCNNMKYPFEDPDLKETTSKERNQAFKRRVIDGENLPPPKNAAPGLAEVILKACMANPGKRYDSAEDMKEALLSLMKQDSPRLSWRKWIWIPAALAALACVYFFLLKPVLFTKWSEWGPWSEKRQEITDYEQMQEDTKVEYLWTYKLCPACRQPNSGTADNCRECGVSLLGVAEGDRLITEENKDAPEVKLFNNKLYWYSGTVTKYRYRTRNQDAFFHTWYLSTYENSEENPGIVFKADGADSFFSVYKNQENMIMVDHRYSDSWTREAAIENNVLTVGFESFEMENGKLVSCYGPVRKVYAREPQEKQIPYDRSKAYADKLLPQHYNGAWIITKYGTNNAFADVETMNLSGEAVIEDCRITVSWTRDGKDKSFEQTFDRELNDGRLYTVVDDAVSYIVSMLDDHTILLNVGLNQAQWVMRRKDVIDESVVHPEAPGFEQVFAEKSDWTASEETRNELANLLLSTVIADGVDPAVIRKDGSFYLALMYGDPAYPLLICEGTGDYSNYLLSVGRGISQYTKEPFVYYHWEDCFFSSLDHPEKSITDYNADETIKLVAGDSIWPVRIDSE